MTDCDLFAKLRRKRVSSFVFTNEKYARTKSVEYQKLEGKGGVFRLAERYIDVLFIFSLFIFEPDFFKHGLLFEFIVYLQKIKW